MTPRLCRGPAGSGMFAHVRQLARLAGVALLVASVLGCGASRRGGVEPSFEPDSIPEAYARPTAAVWWPGTTRAFQIDPRGDLYNGEWMVRLRPSATPSGGAAGAAGPLPASPPRVVAYEERWLPIAHWTREDGPLHWRFEALGLPAPAPRDSQLLVSLLASATNRGASACTASLEVAFEPPDSSVAFAAWDAPRGARSLDGWDRARDGCLGLAPSAAHGSRLVLSWPLAPGERREERIVLAAYPTPPATLRDFARRTQPALAERVRAYWRSALERGARFEIPDSVVVRALDAARVTLLSSRERRGSRWVPIGGPFHYRDVWLRDGARQIQALTFAGHVAEARELAAGLLAFQWPWGAFLSQRGQLDGTGQALWAFDQTLMRPAVAESIGPFAAAAERAIRWCEEQRRLDRERTASHLGLMPPCDPRDNELARGRLVGTDAWTIAGYAAAERLVRAAGRAALADTIARWREGYLGEFMAALARSRQPDLPAAWDTLARDWGNLTVGYPCGVLPAGEAGRAEMARRERALASRVWRAAGESGLASYAHPDSLHGYLGVDLAVAALLSGDRAEADSALSAMLRWRTASGGAAELFSRSSRDFGRNLPPHATAAAALVSLVRNALLYDEGDRLRLTLGARATWWRGTSVRGAPTRWGALDLSFRRSGDTAEWEWTAVPVETELRLPPGAVVAAAEPPLVGAPGGDHVRAPARTSRARVRLREAAP